MKNYKIEEVTVNKKIKLSIIVTLFIKTTTCTLLITSSIWSRLSL